MAKKPEEKDDIYDWLKPWPVLFNRDVNPKKRAFLTAYKDTGSLSAAARMVKVNRNTHYEWMKDEVHPDVAAAYCEAFEEAHGISVASLEMEARRRAIEGVSEPVYYQGVEVGSVRKYSDVLLIFLIKGALPAKYRERVENIPGAPVDVLSDEQLDAKIAELIRKERAAQAAGRKEPTPEPDLRVDSGGDGK